MNKIRDIVYLRDVFRLPKDDLSDMCIRQSLKSTGVSRDLAERVWNSIRPDDKEKGILESVENKVLAGSTSITWYHFQRDESEKSLRELIIEKLPFNPFEERKSHTAEEARAEPMLLSAAVGNSESEFYLRYLFTKRITETFDGTDMRAIPETTIVTIYVDETNKIVEIRMDARNAKKLSSSFSKLIERPILPIELLNPFKPGQAKLEERKTGLNQESENSSASVQLAERFAEVLEGELMDATSTPQLLLKDLTSEQTDAVMAILEILNEFMVDDDEEQLVSKLREATEAFSDFELTIPFTALFLYGMEKIGLRTGKGDLRHTPLYDLLREYMRNQEGVIKIKHLVNETEHQFNVKVAIKSNSIVFTTAATEEDITYVRNRILLSE